MGNTNDFSKVKVGDRLWVVVVGWCTVTDVRSSPTYPITLSNGCTYTINGRQYMEGPQCLFWSEPEVIAPEKPRRMKKVKVEVRPYRERMTGSYNVTTHPEDYPSFRQLFCGSVQTIEVEVDDD